MAVREWQADFRNFTAMSKLHDRGTQPPDSNQIQKGERPDAKSSAGVFNMSTRYAAALPNEGFIHRVMNGTTRCLSRCRTPKGTLRFLNRPMSSRLLRRRIPRSPHNSRLHPA